MSVVIIIIFIAGYLTIAFESAIKINKAAIALITGVLCWTVFIISSPDKAIITERLSASTGEISGIIFFLLGAMVIVELIDAHDGFEIIASRIQYKNREKLLWIISIITFFLSPVLDNLTTSIVMVSLVRKFIVNPKDRLYFSGMIIIAANAGGVWSPIGDVTTTMLWIGGQVHAVNLVHYLFLPGLVCVLVPLSILSFRIRKDGYQANSNHEKKPAVLNQDQYLVFIAGALILISIPAFKTLTGLPPYMGMLIGLGLLWLITEIIHVKKNVEKKQVLSVAVALQRIDTPSILFFLGILLSISALEATGILQRLAQSMSNTVANDNIIVGASGLLSSVVDNVPLVAAAQGMYHMSQYPPDHHFWIFLAYCTGTGGSLLLIGSAAGVAIMGMEKITFLWYLKNITLLAFLGFISGIIVYLLEYYIF
jgi:Na+/H+ antiporter NhaD/arsenite permease-like protein